MPQVSRRLPHPLTAAEVRGLGVRALSYTCDLSHKEQREELWARIIRDHERVDILVNNAACCLGKRFKDLSLEAFTKTMDVNFVSIVHLTKLFLSQGELSGKRLVNINSIAGTMTSQQNGDYCASKFALKAFTDTLRLGKCSTNR